jgi:hypothetical protein
MTTIYFRKNFATDKAPRSIHSKSQAETEKEEEKAKSNIYKESQKRSARSYG